MIKCKECGALIEEQVERCPYCGAINEMGAEQQYMQDMDELKDDLEDLGNIPKEEITREVKKHLKFTGKTVVITLIVVAVLAVVLLLANKSWDIYMKVYEVTHHIRSADAREQLLWEKENYPQLDEWYEEENYDALLDFYREYNYADSGIQYNMSNWEHYALLSYYDEYRECMDFWKRLKDGEIPYLYEYQSPFYEGLDLVYSRNAMYRNDGLDEKDAATIEKWRKDAADFVKEIYDIDDDEIQRLIQEADSGDGYLKYKGLYSYVEEIKDRLPHAD